MIAGNWKMNTTLREATELVSEIYPLLDQIDNIDKVICPPFISLTAVRELIRGSSIKLGAQNLYFEEKGAYTGEISPLMLVDLCEFVIIGHSERRQHFNETGEIVNRKILIAMKVGLKPILCFGEKLEENEARMTKEILIDQLGASLVGVANPTSLIVAYEPIWAIGTGRAATGEQANTTIGFIRRKIAKLYSDEIAQDISILYGGSVTADNIAEFVRQPEIDGALVGGASLKATDFVSIVKQTSETGQ
jgi:triosephosphate isomerase